MGKEANIIQKSQKTAVRLYRLFLKVSMASLIYTLFSLMFGNYSEISVAGAFKANSVTVTLAVMGAVLYQLTYYIYKSGDRSADEQQRTLKVQISALMRVILFFAGAFMASLGAFLVRNEHYYGIALMVVGIVAAQMLYNNRKLFSHFSTFSENAAAGFVIITMKLTYDGSIWAFLGAAITVTLLALQEISFHCYNVRKHHSGGYTSVELRTIRFMVFLRNLLIALIVLVSWWMLVITGSAETLFGSNTYDRLMKIIPIVISLITVSVLLYNNFIKKPPKQVPSYDVQVSEKELRDEIVGRYGEDAISLKALDYVMATMSAAKGYKRYHGEDYFTHPMAVAKILLQNAIVDDKTVAVALLHDCVEDVEGADKEVLEKFGSEMYALVLLVSKNPNVDYRVDENMKAYLGHALSSEAATLVKAADRMHNNSTMKGYPESKKDQKTAETKKHYIPFVTRAKGRYPRNLEFFTLAEAFFSHPIE